MADSQPKRADRLAARVAVGETIRAAARAMKIGERTAYRWAGELGFKARVAELRSAMVSSAAGRLADGMGVAAGKLRALIGKAKDDRVKLAAAKAVIELGMKVAELAELQDRVAAIENQLGANGRSGR
jgi:hypothetical protein